MSLTLSLMSSLKKQSPSPGTDPLPVPYSIVHSAYVQHLHGIHWKRPKIPSPAKSI